MKKSFFIPVVLFLISFSGCRKETDYILYHSFENQSWYRFNKIQFEIPMERTDRSYDIFIFARHKTDYEFDNLDFNMVMTTPSGEERIREYHFAIKDRTGNFIGKCAKDTCEASIPLKKEIRFQKKGLLKIEIENLVPRLETKGVLGIGIRLHPLG